MRLAYLLLLLLFISQCQPSDTALRRWESMAAKVEIIRDDFGVPHVYGTTDAAAVFGLLYAQCEDDFRRVERNFTWAIGRLAEVEGEKALYSDLRARLFMTHDEAKQQYDQVPAWLKKLCEAWADGINYYLHTHPEVSPGAIKKYEPWMALYFTEGSIGGDIERVSTAKLRAFYEHEDQLAHDVSVSDVLEEPGGSNGFAIAGKLTASGNTMLLINPHTSFYFRGEVHMVSEEGLNAYGAVTWGQFFVYQGFNETTGWMHTSTGTDIIDEFAETIIHTGADLHYQYGNERRPVEVQEVTLSYLEKGEMQQRTFPIYRTHHGPITHAVGDKWVATALMWKPVQALTQSYTRTKKKNLAAFHEMMNLRTNSSNNTVFADAEGNIAYYHGNFIPKRDERFDYTKPVDGSDPQTDWQGLHTQDENIVLTNPPNGWIQNCNSTPFTAAAEYSPKKEDYPRYMTSFPENFRGINAQRLLSEAQGLTLDQLIQIAYDPYLPAFEKVIPGLIAAAANAPDAQIAPAIERLKDWDMKTHKASIAMTLAHFYGMELMKSGKAPAHLTGMDRFHYYGTDLPASQRLAIFKQTLAQLEADFGTWRLPWGEVNRFQRRSGEINATFDDAAPSIPVGLATARWGHLAAYGMRGQHDVKKIYGTRGNSFVAAVAFGKQLKAKSLLAGGQSSDPSSPHFDDQAVLYANGQFKEVAFYRTDVEARAEETYHPGKR